MTGRLTGRVWLTPAEYVAMTGKPVDTVYKQLQRGTLRGRKFKGRWRVLASELRNREGVKA
jgi:hypothetical protein